MLNLIKRKKNKTKKPKPNRWSPANVGSWFYSPKVSPGKASPGHTQGLSAPSTYLKIPSLSPTTTASERSLHGTGFIPSVLFLGGEDILEPRFRAEAGKGWPSPLGPPCSPQLSLTGKSSHAAWLQPAPSREVFSLASFMLAVEGFPPCGGLVMGSLKAVEILLLVWSSALARCPHCNTIPLGVLCVCGWRDPVDREILPSSRTVTAQVKGTSDSVLS